MSPPLLKLWRISVRTKGSCGRAVMRSCSPAVTRRQDFRLQDCQPSSDLHFVTVGKARLRLPKQDQGQEKYESTFSALLADSYSVRRSGLGKRRRRAKFSPCANSHPVRPSAIFQINTFCHNQAMPLKLICIFQVLALFLTN